MAFKQSPFPMHTGTSNHSSALKKVSPARKTYTEAYTEQSKAGEATRKKYKTQKEFETAADKWWGSEAGQKRAKSDKNFAHRIKKADTSDKGSGSEVTTSDKVTPSRETKTKTGKNILTGQKYTKKSTTIDNNKGTTTKKTKYKHTKDDSGATISKGGKHEVKNVKKAKTTIKTDYDKDKKWDKKTKIKTKYDKEGNVVKSKKTTVDKDAGTRTTTRTKGGETTTKTRKTVGGRLRKFFGIKRDSKKKAE